MANPYLTLLRENRNYRLLVFAVGGSFFGDWFTSIAVFSLLAQGEGSTATALGLTFVARLLPGLIFSPLGGVLADRVDRRKILIYCDYARSITVLLLLLAPNIGSNLFVYGVLTLISIISALFEPARSALTPTLVGKERIVIANIIGSMLWSVGLIFGTFLGGVITELLGWQYAIIVDSLTYLLSAGCVLRMELDLEGRAIGTEKSPTEVVSNREFLRFLALRPVAMLAVSLKGISNLSGAMYLLLALFGQRVFAVGTEGALGISLLFAARGLGAITGSLITNSVRSTEATRAQFALVILGFFVSGAGYILLGLSQVLALGFLGVFIGHCGGSMIWVWSTALIQLQFPPEMRGRASGIDYTLWPLTSSLSILVCAMVLDAYNLSPRAGAIGAGVVFLINGVLVAVLAKLVTQPSTNDGIRS